MFSDAQRMLMFMNDIVHEMYNVDDYESTDFRLLHDQRVVNVKICHELCHKILLVIQKQMLN